MDTPILIDGSLDVQITEGKKQADKKGITKKLSGRKPIKPTAVPRTLTVPRAIKMGQRGGACQTRPLAGLKKSAHTAIGQRWSIYTCNLAQRKYIWFVSSGLI